MHFAVFLGGKLVSRGGVISVIRPGKLFYITDSASKQNFLVDTGSTFSILPFRSSSPQSGPRLTAANGRRIACWGHRRAAVILGGVHYSWKFLRAAVRFPILGADFLRHFNLLVDVAGCRLLPAAAVSTPSPSAGNYVAAAIADVAGCTAAVPSSSPAAGSHLEAAAVPARPPLHGVAAGVYGPAAGGIQSAKRGAAAGQVAVSSPSPAAGSRTAVAAVPARPPLLHKGPGRHLPAAGGIQSAKRGAAAGQVAAVDSQPVEEPWASLLAKYSGVTASSLPEPIHGVQHRIATAGSPVVSKFRRLDPERLAAARKEFDAMLEAGIVRRSDSGWSSPLHMVRKKDGGWRPCGDFRRLNLITAADKYPLPNMQDLSARLAGCRFFTKLDLQKGYLQVPVEPEDVPKTAVITPFGLFEFVRMPFGLKNAGMTFQRLMDSILNGLPFVFVYLDDILVASPCLESHRRHVAEVLSILSKSGLVINVGKCVFGRESVEFLGHRVSAAGVLPLADRVAAIRQFPPPTTVRELQSFLGLINFYRRFIRSAAQLLLPLTAVLKGGPAGGKKLQWSEEMRRAFAAAKEAIADSCTLQHPLPGAQLSLATDASASHVGAVLQQRQHAAEPWQPLAFWSAKLSATQRGYSAFDRELLAIFLSIRHFRFMLEGRSFIVFTDHKPLLDSLGRISDPWSARQRRQLSYIAEFAATLRHIAGESNVVADTLSRPPAAEAAVVNSVAAAQARPTSSPPVNVRDLAAAQASCPDCSKAVFSPVLRVMTVKLEDTNILVDVSSGVFRPLVPASFRRPIFDAVHSLAHAGERATRRMISSRYLWPGLAADVRRWCRDCVECAAAKVTRHHRGEVQPIAVPLLRFSHLHIDLVGPLPTSAEGYTHLFTIIDRSTRWCEAVPLRSTTADDCAAALISGWVARFGVPAVLTSDRGVQFSSAVWGSFTAKLGVQHAMTTAYHPQSNGMVERLHRRLKDALRARLATAAWPQHLPWVLLGLRSCPREDSGLSSAELVYGSPLTLPGVVVAGQERPAEYFVELFHSRLSSFSPLPPQQRATGGGSRRLCGARYVFVRAPPAAPGLTPAYRGPFRVVQSGEKVFKVQMGTRVEAVSVDRLKPYLGSEPVAAEPPRRGRPPGNVARPPGPR
jgi:transposase InsO family protein